MLSDLTECVEGINLPHSDHDVVTAARSNHNSGENIK